MIKSYYNGIDLQICICLYLFYAFINKFPYPIKVIILQYFVIDALKIILFEHLSCILSKVGETYDAGFLYGIRLLFLFRQPTLISMEYDQVVMFQFQWRLNWTRTVTL